MLSLCSSITLRQLRVFSLRLWTSQPYQACTVLCSPIVADCQGCHCGALLVWITARVMPLTHAHHVNTHTYAYACTYICMYVYIHTARFCCGLFISNVVLISLGWFFFVCLLCKANCFSHTYYCLRSVSNIINRLLAIFKHFYTYIQTYIYICIYICTYKEQNLDLDCCE